jgi:hypothetical protein
MKQGVTRRKVLAYMRKEPNAKPKEIARAIGVSISCVYNVKYELRKAQKLAESTSTLKLPPKLASKPIRIQLIKPIEEHQKEVNKTKAILHTISKGRRRIQGWNPDDNPNYLVRQVDVVNHPPHYKVGGIEVIDFIESKGLTYNLGNVIKYVSRADHKGNKLEDLKKAQWYLNREVSNLEKSK